MNMRMEVVPSPGELLERRGGERFPLNEPLHYRLLDARNPAISGEGKTLNMSSGGIYFTTEQDLPVGRTIEVSVNWPARLENRCALKFVAVGRVLRSDRRRTAVRIERYEFRTRSTSPIPFKAPL